MKIFFYLMHVTRFCAENYRTNTNTFINFNCLLFTWIHLTMFDMWDIVTALVSWSLCVLSRLFYEEYQFIIKCPRVTFLCQKTKERDNCGMLTPSISCRDQRDSCPGVSPGTEVGLVPNYSFLIWCLQWSKSFSFYII